jgi:hypothetical protein
MIRIDFIAHVSFVLQVGAERRPAPRAPSVKRQADGRLGCSPFGRSSTGRRCVRRALIRAL